jgi:hypothetical protein
MNLQESEELQQFKLKPLNREGLAAAMSKAEHYRLLNQPDLAESICRDILAIDPDNQKVAIVLLLALTDQFGQGSSLTVKHAREIASNLKDEYARVYYTGIVHERQGMAALRSGLPGTDFDAYEWYIEAMEFYERADAICAGANIDPKLRWNTCARIIMQYQLRQRPFDDREPMLE